jgi:hypothetical protein
MVSSPVPSMTTSERDLSAIRACLRGRTLRTAHTNRVILLTSSVGREVGEQASYGVEIDSSDEAGIFSTSPEATLHQIEICPQIEDCSHESGPLPG